MDYNLLSEVQSLLKKAYVPPQDLYNPEAIQGGGQQPISNPEEAMQFIMQNLQQGADPNQVAGMLAQSGVPQDVIPQLMQQAMQQLQGGGGGQPQSQITPEQAIQAVQQMMQQGMPPEQIAQQLQQMGVPPEAIEQVMQQAGAGGGQPQGGQPQGAEQPPGPPALSIQLPEGPIAGEIESYANDEIKKLKRQSLPPEERMLVLEKKFDRMAEIVDSLVSAIKELTGMTKQSAYIEGVNEAINQQLNAMDEEI